MLHLYPRTQNAVEFLTDRTKVTISVVENSSYNK